MKSTDIALIILIAAVSMGVSYWLSGLLFPNPDDSAYSYEYIGEVSGNIDEPDQETFNPYALNPTLEVHVGECNPGEIWNSEKEICVSEEESENDENGNNEGENGGVEENGGGMEENSGSENNPNGSSNTGE